MKIFVLHRSDEQVCEKRVAELGQYGEVILCSDKEHIRPGFKKMCSVDSFPEITSWDTAFSRLSDHPEDAWLFENDVRWGSAALKNLFALSSREEELIAYSYRAEDGDPEWYWWKIYSKYFQNPLRSFNPVCRLRKSLVEKTLKFRESNGEFVFHELLFASLATDCFDLENTDLIGSAFRWRPPVREEEMKNQFELYHPVKD